MKYNRFEELPVWQSALDLAEGIFELVEDDSFRGKGDLADQFRRAALSISNNVAEGFERGTTSDLLRFIYYARGSAGEVRSMLRFCRGARWFENRRAETVKLLQQVESIGRQLGGWADSLQNSGIKGQRYLNEGSRETYVKKERVEKFLDKLQKIREGKMTAEEAGFVERDDE